MPLTPYTGGQLKIREQRSFFAREILLPARRFVRVEEVAGWPLLVSTVAALLWANSPWYSTYDYVWTVEIGITSAHSTLSRTLQDWVTDLLLPLFFFVVGMEIKEEIMRGELSHWRRAMVPVAAAIGGMIVPAAIYLLLNARGGRLDGWGIPVATDIAFAVGVVALLGPRVPSGLKVLLLAFAAVDDIGGILIIAIYYSQGLSGTALLIAAIPLMLIVAMRIVGIEATTLYILAGVAFVFCFIVSGVHATVAGVILGLIVPARPYFSEEVFAQQIHRLLDRLHELAQDERHEEKGHLEEEVDFVVGQIDELAAGTESPITRIKRDAYPWVSYFVLPLFALAHAGLHVSRESLESVVTSPVSLGILAGLVIGKPIGIVGSIGLVQWIGLGRLPSRVSAKHIVGMGLIAGIGFTVSLFITELAFRGTEGSAPAKLAVLLASIAAAAIGSTFFLVAVDKQPASEPQS